VDVVQYGRRVTKTVKTFLATWPPVGGPVRVVLVRESPGWLAFFSTALEASVTEILEAVADRSAIEQTFHDVKEVEGAGQQQLRHLWANLAAWNLNLWAHTLVELWAWSRPKAVLCDRRQSPWDDPARRPSHADRRKALQRTSLQQAFSVSGAQEPRFRKIRRVLKQVLRLVA
jgi:hypothetical protein